MFRDRYGLPLSTQSAAAADCYNDGVARTQAANAGAAAALQEAIAADAGFALAYIALANALRFQGQLADAKQQAARARELVAGGTRREQQHVEALATAIAGEASRARTLVQEHLAEFPRDAMVLGTGVILISLSGQQDRHAELESFITPFANAYGDDWYFLGTYAFALQELNRLEEARQAAQRSLELYPRGGGATHSLTHVFFETDDHGSGAQFLGDWLADYDREAPQHCHLSWHLALFALAAGQYQQALRIYARDIQPALGHSRTAMYDAASLLWRAQLYGGTALPLPWVEVCPFAQQTAAQPGIAFNDANAAFALSATGDEAAFAQLVAGLEKLADQGHPTAGRVVLPLVQAVGAFARGGYTEAIGFLEPVADQVIRIGGSNAQREVFEDTLIEAYLRAERYEQAEIWLRRRLQRRTSARDLFWLGRAATGRGRLTDAQASFTEAQRRWSTAEAETAEQTALRQAHKRVLQTTV
jgi:tetratricopeptide (TPR) repeat protein